MAAGLPRGVAEVLSDTLATLASTLPLGGVASLRDNLEKILPQVPRALLRGAVRSYGRYYLEIMRLSQAEVTRAVGPLRWHGAESLEASLQRGRGAVVLSGHVGNWDLAGMALAQRFGGITVYVERLRPAALYEFYRATRGRHGCDVVDAGGGSRAAIRTLTQNGLVGIVADRSFGSAAARVRFGSGEIDVPIGGMRLAQRTGAALHSVFCVRQADGYDCFLQPEIRPQLQARSTFQQQAATEFAQRLEAIVRRYPDQWCLMHPTVHPEGAA
jgi:KDO2-lipid IV(A) lauroyltransferase